MRCTSIGLLQIPLLEGAEESFLRSVSMEIKQTLFIPGDHIVRKGEVGKEVYYIHKGEVSVAVCRTRSAAGNQIW